MQLTCGYFSSNKYVLPKIYWNWLLAIFQQIYQAELGPDEGKIDCCKNITKTLPFEKCQNNGQLTNDGWANGQKHNYFLRKKVHTILIGPQRNIKISGILLPYDL